MNIAAIGHSTLDIFLQLNDGHLERDGKQTVELCIPFPAKLYIGKRQFSLGGNAVNVGAALLKNAHKVYLISRTGQDELGAMTLNALKEEGFDLTYSSRHGDSDFSVVLNYGQDRTILSFHGEEVYGFPEDIEDIDWVYLSSLGFEDYQTFHLALLAWLKKHPDVPVLYNPGKIEIHRGFSTIEEIAKYAHTLIVNLDEARKLLLPLATVAIAEDEAVESLLDIYMDLGVNRILITNGREGAYFSDAKGVHYHVSTYDVEVMDATGAGDAFASGYMSAILEGIPPKEALLFGIAQSANVIQYIGATHGVLPVDKLQDLIRLKGLKLKEF